MQFISQLKVLPEKYEEAVRCFKHPKITDNIEIKSFLGLFGPYDALLIFEAPTEADAAEFVTQFLEVAKTSTSVAFPVDAYRWTK